VVWCGDMVALHMVPIALLFYGLGLRFRVKGFYCFYWAQGLVSRVSWLRVHGSGFRNYFSMVIVGVLGKGFRVKGEGFRFYIDPPWLRV
jgi:hypothetical protein